MSYWTWYHLKRTEKNEKTNTRRKAAIEHRILPLPENEAKSKKCIIQLSEEQNGSNSEPEIFKP